MSAAALDLLRVTAWKESVAEVKPVMAYQSARLVEGADVEGVDLAIEWSLGAVSDAVYSDILVPPLEGCMERQESCSLVADGTRCVHEDVVHTGNRLGSAGGQD